MTTTDMTPYEKYQALYGPDGFLASYNVEREDEIELLGLSTFSAVDCLFLGDPGVGKTWMIELQLACIVGAELFDILLLKEMSADDVLGPRSLPALKDGRIERIIQGYLPTAHYAYVDEVFKASPPLLNALLDLMAKRQLKIGGKVIDCSQLISIYFSSNELPDREDLMAMRDRIGITKEVKPVRTDEGKLKVTDIQLGVQGGGIDMTDAPQFTLPEIAQVRSEIQQIHVPETVKKSLVEAQGKWESAGHPPSQRRMGQMWRVIKTHAWAKGQDEVTNDNLIVAQHMAWNHPDHADSAREVIMEYAGQFTRVANRIRIALEPQLTKLDELRGKLDSDDGDERDKAMEEAWSVMRSLRTLRKDAKAEIERGKASGHDVRELEKVRSEINRAHDYAESAFSDDDENGNGD
jgi:MoxR-like ATPase